jgi:hypothetical protein
VLETLQHLQRLTAYGVAYRSFTESYIDSQVSTTMNIYGDAMMESKRQANTKAVSMILPKLVLVGVEPTSDLAVHAS